ncbi:MAG: hypothetical protein RIM23_24080 [Coleofasciculus sp. G3-WIS-01]
MENKNRSIREIYDLVLTFDCENLNTSIEKNAQLLKERLEAVGLGANHGKALHIVAHSMGGLVSRWFIEQEGGNKVVQHLIMLGTPNAGSPWATVKEWATMVMAVGMNSLSQTPLPVKALGSLSEAMMNTVEVALDQMQPNSQFLQALAASNDPGIPYSCLRCFRKSGWTSRLPDSSRCHLRPRQHVLTHAGVTRCSTRTSLSAFVNHSRLLFCWGIPLGKPKSRS